MEYKCKHCGKLREHHHQSPIRDALICDPIVFFEPEPPGEPMIPNAKLWVFRCASGYLASAVTQEPTQFEKDNGFIFDIQEAAIALKAVDLQDRCLIRQNEKGYWEWFRCGKWETADSMNEAVFSADPAFAKRLEGGEG